MLLSRYDFYDIYEAILKMRFNPLAPENTIVAEKIMDLLKTPQKDNIIESNLVRKQLSSINDLNNNGWDWVFVNNVYTYGTYIIKDEWIYRLLIICFQTLLSCLDTKNEQQIYCIADALHNIPIILTEGGNLKKQIKLEISYYRKKYDPNFLKAFVR